MKSAKGQARVAKSKYGTDKVLGATLQTARTKNRRAAADVWAEGRNIGARHTTDDGGGRGQVLHSVWETNDLQSFLYQAEQQAKDFAAERNTRVTQGGVTHVVQDDKMRPLADGESSRWYTLSERLPIPVRPPWTHDMRKAQVEEQERLAFNEWRRQLAAIEEREGVLMTPFERNLEVWRQLWRVIERSEIVMMIVDARNPLAFNCKAVERSVEKEGKKFALLLNKAELLTDRQRRSWARHFEREGVLAIFFSAAASRAEQERLEGRDASKGRVGQEPADTRDRVAEDHEMLREEEAMFNEEEDDDEPEDEPPARTGKLAKKPRRNQRKLKGAPQMQDVPHWAQPQAVPRRGAKREPAPQEPALQEEEERSRRVQMVQKVGGLEAVIRAHKADPAKIYTPDNLVDFALLHRSSLSLEGAPVTMGFVGYPNVGKSSTINALWQSKRVNVSATPGKTKHFQTLKLEHERRVMLCDCPGLVFPSFASTRDHMVVDGVLPISQLRDAVATMQIVAKRVPKHVFELLYTLDLDVPQEDSPTLAHHIANAYARARGYMTDHNKANTNRAARDILKDYVDGKLVYVWPPPNPDDISEASSESEEEEEYEEDEECEEEEVEEVEEEEGGEDLGIMPRGHVDPQDWEVVRRAVGAVDSDDEVEKKDEVEGAKFNKENANMDHIYDKVQRKWAERRRKARPAREYDETGIVRDEAGNVMVEVSDDEVEVVEVEAADEAAGVPGMKPMTKRQRRKMEQAEKRGRVGCHRHGVQRQAVQGAAGYQPLVTA